MSLDPPRMNPIKERRLGLGMTLAELAAECTRRGAPISEGSISRIERGQAEPRPRLRAVLADILTLDIYLRPKDPA